MTDQDTVLREDHGSVRLLVLNRPESYNAWGEDMAAALGRELCTADEDEDVRCCVLTGSGEKAFSSGANLKDPRTHMTPSADEALAAMRPASAPMFFEDLLTFRKPLISAVNGYAIGAGFLLTLCTDIIIAAENAVFALPQASLGIMPAYGGAVRLAQWVGRGRAMDIALTGRRVDATEARDIGIASQVVPVSELRAASLDLAGRLAGLPPLGAALTKESLNRAMEEGALKATSITDLYRFLALGMTDEARRRHENWRSDRTND